MASTYEAPLADELEKRRLRIERRASFLVVYRGGRTGSGSRFDLVVDAIVGVKVKAVERIVPIRHDAILGDPALSGVPTRLVLNVKTFPMSAGIHRLVHDPPPWVLPCPP